MNIQHAKPILGYPSQRAAIASLADGTRTVREIADMTGVCPKTIRIEIKRAGGKAKPADIKGEWPQDRIDDLRRYIAEGLTGPQIAEIFGVSRNAISGKVERLKIAGPRRAERKRSAPKQPRQPRSRTPQPPRALWLKPEPIPATAVTLMDLHPGMCKWPIGEPREPTFVYCGAHAHDVSDAYRPYCPDHAARSRNA